MSNEQQNNFYKCLVHCMILVRTAPTKEWQKRAREQLMRLVDETTEEQQRQAMKEVDGMNEKEMEERRTEGGKFFKECNEKKRKNNK